MLERLNEILEEEFQQKNEALISELETTQNLLNKAQRKLVSTEKENRELKNQLKQIEMFEIFKGLININNLHSLLSFLKLKRNNWPINGMDSEDIPKWFELVFEYYEDRDKLFTIMDIFSIEYPSWAKNYVMPYEYSKEELKIFIDPRYDRYVCNGQIFDGNIGFFWRNIESSKCISHKILTNKNSFQDYIPWQLVLSNPLWKSKELFDKILEAIKNKRSNSHYFFAISNYQELSKEQAKELAKLLPKGELWDEHKKFIENNKNILKDCPELVEKFKDRINDNKFSPFYYLNYPVEMQKDFIRNQSKNYYTKLDLIKKMEISKEDKLKFLNEFAEKEL